MLVIKVVVAVALSIIMSTSASQFKPKSALGSDGDEEEEEEEVGTCGDFTVDTCIVETEGALETVKDVDAENCQNYCNLIYEKDCK